MTPGANGPGEGGGGAEGGGASAPACPICGRPAGANYRPFCSRRCSDVDLQRWFSGRYVIPGREPEADPDA